MVDERGEGVVKDEVDLMRGERGERGEERK